MGSGVHRLWSTIPLDSTCRFFPNHPAFSSPVEPDLLALIYVGRSLPKAIMYSASTISLLDEKKT